MEHLPQEVVDKIAGYLPDRHQGKRIRPALATLSRAWQCAIEPLTFRSLRITSDHLGDFFYPAFATPRTHRRRLLRDLNLDIVLPSYSDDDCAKYETASDRAANNRMFSHHVAGLLRELSRWPASDGGKLNLVIGAYSPMDIPYRGQDKMDRDRYEVALGRRKDLFGERYRYSYIHFAAADAHPVAVVPCVTSFYAHPGPRCLDPGSLVALTAAFPNLERINWSYEDPTYFLALRRPHWRDFARAVAGFPPPSACQTLYIRIDTPWYPHNESLPDLRSGDGVGPGFCNALRAMLGRSSIQRLDYEGPVDSALFWSQEELPFADDGTASWQSLSEIEVRFGLGSLETGQWYFMGQPGDRFYDPDNDVPLSLREDEAAAGLLLPPGYYDSDSQNEEAVAKAKSMEMPQDGIFAAEGCEPRCIPRDEAICPLLAAVARRLACTPSLRSVYLEAALPGDKGVWFFSFHAPGKVSDWDEYVDDGDDDPLARARVFLHAEDWRPDEGTLAMLRGIGRAACHGGEDAIVTFLPFLY